MTLPMRTGLRALLVGAVAVGLASQAGSATAKPSAGAEHRMRPFSATQHPKEAVGLASQAGPATAKPSAGAEHRMRPFSASSWWNTPVPDGAPQHPSEAAVLDYLRTAPQNGGGFLRLAGAGRNRWGQPVFWASSGDKEYNVRWDSRNRPAELDNLRIPSTMQGAATSDGALTLFDRERGYVVAMTRAVHDSGSDTWSVDGATVTYLDSNGLHRRTGQSDDPRNTGSHRGNNGATMMARLDQVETGSIDNVLKISCGPECSTEHTFPMVGSDGDSATSPLKQGLRMRIRPDVNLDSLGLHPQALVIARAAQEYGVYFGDSGGVTALKLENTVAEGRGQQWSVSAKGLSKLPFTARYWDVLPEAYDPGS